MNNTLIAFSIFDNKVEAHGKPLFFRNVHEAKADLAGALLQSDKVNPVDYELFELGTYSTQDGKFIPLDKPKHICNLRSLSAKPEKETA